MRISHLEIDLNNEKLRDEILSEGYQEIFDIRWHMNSALRETVVNYADFLRYFDPFKTFKDTLIDFLKKFERIKSRIAPIEFYFGILILIPLGVIGIVLPLYALPYPQEKGWLMGSFTLMIALLCGYFTYEIIKIKRIGNIQAKDMLRERIMDFEYKIHNKKLLSELRTKIRSITMDLRDLQNMDEISLLEEIEGLPDRKDWKKVEYFISLDPWILEVLFHFFKCVEEIRHPSTYMKTREERISQIREDILEAVDDGDYLIKKLPVEYGEIIRFNRGFRNDSTYLSDKDF